MSPVFSSAATCGVVKVRDIWLFDESDPSLPRPCYAVEWTGARERLPLSRETKRWIYSAAAFTVDVI
jgi:hypothetical protein